MDFLDVFTLSSLFWLTSLFLLVMSSDEEPLNGLISKTRECRNENYKIAIINYVSLHLLFNLGVDRDPESFCWYLLEAGTFLRLSSSCYHDYQCCLSYTSVRIDFLVHYRILGSWLLVNHFLVLVVYPIFSHLQTQLLCYLSIFLAVSVLLVWLSCAPKWIPFSPNATWVSLQKTAESTTFTTCGRFCLYKHSCVSLSSLSKLLWSVEHTLCIGTFMNTKVHFSSTFMKDDICISTFLLMLQRISRRRNGEMMDTIPFVIIISTTWWLQTARLVADTTDPSNWNGHRIIGLFFHNENILNISIR